MMPFSFIIVDRAASLNGTNIPLDGKDVNRWRHLRPAHSSGPFRFPAEDMNWFVDCNTNLLRTECLQVRPDGTRTNGQRDYSRHFTPGVPADTKFAPPDSIQCTSTESSIRFK